MPQRVLRPPQGNKNMAEGSVSSGSSSSSSEGNNKAAGDTPMMLIPAPPPTRKKSQSPQQTIDEFWAKFNSKTPGKGWQYL